MFVAVITPFHLGNKEFVEGCIKSVNQQSYPGIMHVVVGDGCDLPSYISKSDFPNLHFIRLPKNINDYGDTPRSIATAYAFAHGAEAVAFLDSDNWWDPKHIEIMVKASIDNDADVVVSKRLLCHEDGRVMGECDESDGIHFSDTNCMFVRRKLREQAGSWWLIPHDEHAIDDRVIWDRLVYNTSKICRLDKFTVYYRTNIDVHYKKFGFPLPENTVSINFFNQFGLKILKYRGRAIARYSRIKNADETQIEE